MYVLTWCTCRRQWRLRWRWRWWQSQRQRTQLIRSSSFLHNSCRKILCTRLINYNTVVKKPRGDARLFLYVEQPNYQFNIVKSSNQWSEYVCTVMVLSVYFEFDEYIINCNFACNTCSVFATLVLCLLSFLLDHQHTPLWKSQIVLFHMYHLVSEFWHQLPDIFRQLLDIQSPYLFHTCQFIFIITTLIIRHSFAVLVQAKNVSVQQHRLYHVQKIDSHFAHPSPNFTRSQKVRFFASIFDSDRMWNPLVSKWSNMSEI